MKLICACGTNIHKASVIDLKDIKDFRKRKILTGKCPHCHNIVLSLSETRISDGKVFINENLYGKQAFNLLFKEKANIITQSDLMHCKDIHWAYGQNVQVKNSKGEIVMIRQYAKDFRSGKRTLEKEIKLK